MHGEPGSATVRRNARGQYEAVVTGTGNTVIAQRVGGLAPGSYSASVDVEVEKGKTRPTFLTVHPEHGKKGRAWLDRSTAVNSTASDERHGTNAQRVRVFFDVPAGSDSAELSFRVAEGVGAVVFDNVRVVAMPAPAPRAARSTGTSSASTPGGGRSCAARCRSATPTPTSPSCTRRTRSAGGTGR
ncbi:hypothetical protein ACFQV2_17150 [Actinokineospora soli]|uniref:Uncharacterized protein n=1 Tax=Actinokineospora soli TaxID=1048753 RepID=A0ABW2TNA1_9PSEU